MESLQKRKQNIFGLRVGANAHNPLVVMLSGGGETPGAFICRLFTMQNGKWKVESGKYLSLLRKMSVRTEGEQLSREVLKEHFIFYLPPLRGKSLRSRGRGVNHD